MEIVEKLLSSVWDEFVQKKSIYPKYLKIGPKLAKIKNDRMWIHIYIYICLIKNYAIFIVDKNIVCLFQLSDLVFYFRWEYERNLS